MNKEDYQDLLSLVEQQLIERSDDMPETFRLMELKEKLSNITK